jgi:hypothetical protein
MERFQLSYKQPQDSKKDISLFLNFIDAERQSIQQTRESLTSFDFGE